MSETQTPSAPDPAAPKKDERVREMSALRKALIRPELGAICGTILVFMFFIAIARDSGMFAPEGIINWGTVAAQFAIIAVGACLLMIAGEFDLSVGSMIGFSGVVIALMIRAMGLPRLVRHPRRLPAGAHHRRAQRLPGHQDRPALLHRHPRLSLHPARPDHLHRHRHHPQNHHRRRQGCSRGRSHRLALRRQGLQRPVCLARRSRHWSASSWPGPRPASRWSRAFPC